jgi:ubiquinone biosynthesis protein COQ9
MTKNIDEIKDKIISEAIKHVTVNGWTWREIEESAKRAGFNDGMEYAVFPAGLNDAVAHFSVMVDRRMMDKLKNIPMESLRMRDRVRVAVMTRFQIMAQMGARDIMRSTLSYWALPTRVMMGQQILWRTADHIWSWAGDTATDYNRYTKRGLLASIIMGTSLVFIDDDTDDLITTRAFLDRRIDNIMEVGKIMGGAKTMASTFMNKYNNTRRS